MNHLQKGVAYAILSLPTTLHHTLPNSSRHSFTTPVRPVGAFQRLPFLLRIP
nr:MAG TPA: hypothetical protein [Caudoviricetes sp.]